MNVLESGFLFAAGDCSNHSMFSFTSLGEDEEPIISNSTMDFDEDTVANDHKELIKFCPRTEYQNLEVTDSMQNLACINDLVVKDLIKDSMNTDPQIYLTCGKANHGTLRQLTHGLTVLEMATSPMPMVPTKVMTLKADLKDQFDKYLIVSSADASLILGINEGKISSIGDSKFAIAETTIHVSTMHDGSFVQVTPTRVIHIRDHLDKKAKNSEWNCDGGRYIFSACSNSR